MIRDNTLRFLPTTPTMAASTPTPALSSHERTRVEDYLNDKIQVSADFESVDSLLSSLRAQHDLQRKQVLTFAQFWSSFLFLTQYR